MTVLDVPSAPTTTPLGDPGDTVPARTHSELHVATNAAVVAIEAARGAANGYASLDSGGKIPDSEIPTTIARDTELAAAVAALVASAPGTLDTLDELAAALGDDPNFATTITTLIGTKVAKSLYDANSLLIANSDDTPVALSMGASTIVARLAAGGIVAATPAELKTLLAIAEADVTGLVADLAAKQKTIEVSQIFRTAGNVMLNNASWTDVPTIGDLTVPAGVVAGDLLEIGLGSKWVSGTTFTQLDVATIVSAAVVNYASTRTSTPGDIGYAAWRGTNTAPAIGFFGALLYVVQAGDISGGTVTLRLRYKQNSATNTVLGASTTDGPLNFYVKNLGQG